MQKQLIFIGLAVVGLVAIWTLTGSDDQTVNDVSTVLPTTANEQAVSTGDTQPAPSDITDAVENIEATDAAPDDTTDVEDTAASPFTVLPQPGASEEGNPDQSSTVAENANAAEGVGSDSVASGSGAQASPGIVVPNSYPASEAAKYFVPADQRRPGNLGGPPPPPGIGNSESAFPDDGTLAPPAPPGQ
ncbi:MAG: hypothetical protein AB8B64_03825 [Granulosicoccus sp.]